MTTSDVGNNQPAYKHQTFFDTETVFHTLMPCMENTMFDRDLPDDLVDALNQSPFWGNICEDRELHPEIRRRCITVYYKGRGLIRDMQVRAGVLTGKVHWKYVPTQQPTNDDYFDLVSQTCGLEFVSPVLPRSPGLCTREILKDYKCQMDGARSFPESDLIQKIICREENQVLDQEVAFQDQDTARDKIDLCNFDTGLQKLTFVEVKQVDDARLSAKKGPPEVLEATSSLRVPLESAA